MRALRGALVAAIAAVLALPVAAQAATGGARDVNDTYSSSEGTVAYQVHLPPTWTEDAEMPVIMAIHGCAMSGYGLNSMKDTTQLNTLADREGFIVVYPTQSPLRSLDMCWKSLDPAQQYRGSGEPELLAGAARQVVDDFGADPRRVHVVGASSGAGTAVILAVTYPDVFATSTSVAGGEYGFHQVDLEDPDTITPQELALQAHAQMGPRERRVPLLVIQGDQDTTVPPVMAERLVQEWLALAELVGGDPVSTTPDTVERNEPAGLYPWTRTTYGSADVESVLIEGQGHAWSGPDAVGLFTDRLGPDLSAMVWDFAKDRVLD